MALKEESPYGNRIVTFEMDKQTKNKQGQKSHPRAALLKQPPGMPTTANSSPIPRVKLVKLAEISHVEALYEASDKSDKRGRPKVCWIVPCLYQSKGRTHQCLGAGEIKRLSTHIYKEQEDSPPQNGQQTELHCWRKKSLEKRSGKKEN